jgi:aryl sulfotransferase
VLRYRSADEDSGRWQGFPFRPGDIVISTRSKSGTTWLQQICASLIHGRELPEPLGTLSPWVDHLVESREALLGRLERQPFRRVLKTHTPLDGIVLDPRATYLVGARVPVDAAVSLYHQGDNLDRERLRELTGAPLPAGPRPPLRDWLVRWVAADADPRAAMDSPAGYCHHLADAWSRRYEPNVVLVHYDDLLADLGGEIRRLASRLGIEVAGPDWDGLVRAATFGAMRDRAADTAPNRGGVLKDVHAFFRRGTSGAGAEVLDAAEYARYRRRTALLLPPDLDAWLHRDAPA